MKEIRPTTKPISARVNRAAWDWLEMQGVNKNQLLNDLLVTCVMAFQHRPDLLEHYIKRDWGILEIIQETKMKP